jgi:hypothetical protein
MSSTEHVYPRSTPTAQVEADFLYESAATTAPGRGRFARLALLILALVLPFELRTPWLNIGPLVFTNVELVVIAALGLWIATRVAERRLPRVGVWVAWAVLALAVAMLLSALLAPANRAEALKFSLRSFTGMALFFAALDLLRTPRQRWTIAAALVVGAALSALLGVLEAWAPGVPGLLSIFKTGPTRVGALVRASGTFEYTNIAAMVWEAALPLALVVLSSRTLAAKNARQVPYWMLIAVLCEALILTFSRAALIGAVAAFALMSFVAWRRGERRLLRNTVYAGGLLAALTLLTYAMTPAMTARLLSESDADWYKVAYQSPPSFALRAGEIYDVAVTVRNDSVVTWPATGANRVALSYHFLDPKTEQIVHLLGYRTYLPRDLQPGEEVTLDMRIYALRRPGAYLLMWDMVQESPDPEGTVWFSIKSGTPPLVPVEIVGDPIAVVPPSAPQERQLLDPRQPSRILLWQIALMLWRERPLLGVGPDNFRHLYGPHTGFDRWDTRIHTNNMYVEALVNLGLIGGAIFVLVLGGGLWLAHGSARSRTSVLLATGVFGALGAFAVHGLFDYFLEFTPTYLLFWLLLGLSAALWRDARPSAPAWTERG